MSLVSSYLIHGEPKMSMIFTAESGGGPPAGSYPAAFVGCEPFEGGESSKDYGPAVKLIFQILGGDLMGMEATRIVSHKMTPNTNLRKFASAIKGAPIDDNEEFNAEQYFGTVGLIVVVDTDNGWTKVDAFIRQPAEPVQQPVPAQQPMPVQHPVPSQQPMPVQQPVPSQQPMPVQQPVPAQQPMPVQQPVPAQQPVADDGPAFDNRF